MNELATTPRAEIAPLSDAARAFARKSRAANTVRAYDQAWRHFGAWCAARGVAPLPATPATVADYLTALAQGVVEPDAHGPPRMVTRTVATLHLYKCAISSAHRLAAFAGGTLADPTKHPTVDLVWQGIRRELGAAPRPKDAITPRQLSQMVLALGEDPRGLRDRAMLVLGLCGAFRRSELCALQVHDVRTEPEGLRVTLRRSKTDQAGRGRVVGVAAHPEASLCPVRCLDAWTTTAAIRAGPLFRAVDRWGHVADRPLNPLSFVLRLKAAARAAGLDPRRVAGHSLRAGFVTAAIGAGAPVHAVMDVSGHKSFDILRRYIREASLWKENAGTYLKL